MNATLLTVDIRTEQDVVLARQRARHVAGLLGFTPQEQTSIATAVSEIARNAFRYAGRGRAEFALEYAADDAQPILAVRITDRGPGIPNLAQILDGQYKSSTGMGVGIIGSRRLSDHFTIESTPGAGTSVFLGRRLPRRGVPITAQLVSSLTAELAQRASSGVMEELQQQNTDLLHTMEALQARQQEVERLNDELAETNRGVLALYAELDEKAISLQRASEYKSRFLSDMSHELRTPLNAMISLSGLLLERVDGELTEEQEKQVRFIRRSALSLSEMVNDLLDLAKIEAGKVDVRLSRLDLGDLLTAIRGMFRPLVDPAGPVAFVVDDPPAPIKMLGDEGKVSQILRNFVSNALKFTERGEVRVYAALDPERPDLVHISVSDTGIGIAESDQSRIFHDFTQVDSAVQRRVRGTGLGLPLSRKLARLLGGDVTLRSAPGEGSTFTVTLPLEYTAHEPNTAATTDVTGGGTHG